MHTPFRQVDVFSSEPLLGNPVAVVHAADGISDETMAAFARWTNLSETTFLLSPTAAEADYRLRIFTPGGELPFAGHPTLGSAHAWLEAGGTPRGDDIVQECGAGLVSLRRDASGGLAFAAPPLLRSGRVEDTEVDRVLRALRITRSDVVDIEWVDNGPGMIGVLLRDANAVLALSPDFAAFDGLRLGVAGLYPEGGECAVEVRAFVPELSVPEDPVTGSLNAGIAQWLTRDGVLPSSYTASQGTVLGRKGRVRIETDASGQIWVGGDTVTTIVGTSDIGM